MTGQLRGLHLLVSGVVQGVGFRWFVERAADNFRLTGWVKNLYDGTVESYAEGNEGALIGFLDEVRIGPQGGRVTGVKVEWMEHTGKYSDFRITF
ncbi:MAG: acylphosphatase [candidate division Zixibacteria bacterium]